jgi:riboflavin synthase
MFTGIIEEAGQIIGIDESQAFRTIRVRVHKLLDDLQPGSSIAVNGVCLTVRSPQADGFSAELSNETLQRTTLGQLRPGAVVNLERPMRADSRFGGHIVQGHVDGTGQIRHFTRNAGNWDLEIEFPGAAARYIVEKGSIAVDGISLTVAALRPKNAFSIAIIPHTFDNTNLQAAKAGDRVNLEYDVVAKYVESLLKPYDIRNH